MATSRRRRRPADEDEAPRRRKKSSGTKDQVVKLDLRKTEHGKKGGARYPEGEYKVKVSDLKRVQAQSGNTQIQQTLTIIEPAKYKGKTLLDRLTLTEAAMHRVGWLLDAAGIKWTQKIMSLPLKKLDGKVIGVQLYDDEYNNRISSKVSEYYSEEEIDDLLNEEDDEDEDDEDLDDEEDEDEEDEDDEDDDEDLDELDDEDL